MQSLSLLYLLCPSIFWGPRLIARSPHLRRREKNLEPQKIDGLSTIKSTNNFGMDKVKKKPGYPGCICASSTHYNSHNLASINYI